MLNNNHIKISAKGVFTTNVYFGMWLLTIPKAVTTPVSAGITFMEFFVIANVSLLIVSLATLPFNRLGDYLMARNWSSGNRLLLKSAITSVVFILGVASLLFIHFKILKGYTWNLLPTAIYDGIFNRYFISLIVFFLLISCLMFFISNLERRSGSITRLLAQSMGETVKPKLVERGFIFIDLNGATSLAETLESKRYAELLRICFKLLNEIAALTPFEVYQYVGDEAVLSWDLKHPKGDILSLQMFMDYKAYLKEHEDFFLNAYGILPNFKCAIHAGEVVESEIGKGVKHFVYHGDVLNTTSRLLGSCHQNSTDLIISKSTIKNRVMLEAKFEIDSIQKTKLKGKNEFVEAFKVKLRALPDVNRKRIEFDNFFLNIN
ncbi:MAG: adenylate/guanylate cyclase domain-containing protein [Bacteroidota bacterium]